MRRWPRLDRIAGDVPVALLVEAEVVGEGSRLVLVGGGAWAERPGRHVAPVVALERLPRGWLASACGTPTRKGSARRSLFTGSDPQRAQPSMRCPSVSASVNPGPPA